MAEKALLSLKVCDPAVGSGHFLVGAAHRLARHLARVRAQAQGESEPSPLLYQHALRDVIGRCLYGVDLNPMAAELCRVSLWLEALEPGKPLSFLDHHIRVGNSLLGTTPELIVDGLPDAAFEPIEGDDKKVCAALKRRNRQERDGGQTNLDLPMVAEPRAAYDTLASLSQSIDQVADDSLNAIRRKAEQFQRLTVSPDYRHRQQLADAWCAAFVWCKRADAPAEPITTDTLRRLETDADGLSRAQCIEVERLASQYRFFHGHLAFPEVFAGGGFDCILANPPWERVKHQEKEWFATRSPEIANAPNAAARKRLIEALERDDPALHQQFLDDARKAEGESCLLRNSGRYPLCGRGDINLYAVFAEGMRSLLNERGRAGAVLPTGIATDDTTKFFFQDVVDKRSLVSLFDFENKGVFFPEVHSSYKFCLFTAGGGLRPTAQAAEYVFFAHSVEELRDPGRRFSLSPADIALLNPNTRTCPIFRSRKDAELTRAIYRRVPVLVREAQGDAPEENPWGIRFSTMFHMSNDSHLFRTREQLEAEGWRLEGNVFRRGGEEYLPLYEGRLGHQFNHRFASQPSGVMTETQIDELRDPFFVVEPQYWVRREHADEHLSRRKAACRTALLGFRRVARDTDERTCIATLFPWGPATYGWILSFGLAAIELQLLCGTYNSVVFDYLLRNSLSQPSIPQGIFEQLSAPSPSTFGAPCEWSQCSRRFADWVLPRVLELTISAWDLEPFARDCGWDAPPFRWDEERRFLIRCELDAAFFHIYLPADADGQ